jgi:hypothetical protein
MDSNFFFKKKRKGTIKEVRLDKNMDYIGIKNMQVNKQPK